MGETVYIHDRHTGAIGFIFKDPDTKAVFTGVEVHSEDESPELEALESRTGLRFFRPGQSPSLPLYGVPEIYVLLWMHRAAIMPALTSLLRTAPFTALIKTMFPTLPFLPSTSGWKGWNSRAGNLSLPLILPFPFGSSPLGRRRHRNFKFWTPGSLSGRNGNPDFKSGPWNPRRTGRARLTSTILPGRKPTPA